MSPPEDEAGPTGVLTRLDRRLVPRMQRGARRVAGWLGAPLHLVARTEERFFPRLVRRVVPAWRVPALLAAVIVLLASAVHLQRFPELRDGQRDVAAGPEAPAGRTPTSGAVDPLDVSGRSVGPRQGADLDDYVEDRRDELRSLDPERTTVAVVSLEEYATAEDAIGLLPDDVRVLRAQYRIPAEGERPQEARVGEDADAVEAVTDALRDAITPIDEEITEVEALLESGTVEDEAFAADLERRLEELRAVRNVLAAAPAVVFAVVVEGPAGELQALAERDGVRLVDPAPEGVDPDETAFFGLLPEDRDRASFGAAR